MPPEEVQGVLGRAFSNFARDIDTAKTHLSRLAEGSVIVGAVRGMRPEDQTALATSFVPGVGDAAGLYADYTDIRENWDQVPWYDKAGMVGAAALGALPFVPSRAQINAGANTLLHRGDHAAPTRTGEYAPLHEMNKTYPDDIYDKSTQVRYYGHGAGDSWEQESFDVINAARGNPDMEIEVYRAVPNSAPDEVYAGDWVTPSKGYAQSHGERFGDDGGKVLTTKVRAGDLFTEGNSPHEFGWSPTQTFDPTTADISHLSRPDQLRYESAIGHENWERAAELAKKPTLVPREKTIAYHGSPHDFPPVRELQMPDGDRVYQSMDDAIPEGAKMLKEHPLGRFNMSKIGTGEGAQAYGHGLYFAEAEDVATGYRDALTTPTYRDGTPLRGREKYAYQRYQNEGMNIDDLVDEMEHRATSRVSPDHVRKGAAEELPYLKKWQTEGVPDVDEGRMYEVEIDASPDEFLDWDLPLSEQMASNPKINEVVKDLESQGRNVDVQTWRGETLLDRVHGSVGRNKEGSEAIASQLLRDKGIKGIRYKDANSRGADGGTSNYVVFDENLINIAKKYGIAIPAAAAMLARQTGQNPQDLYEDDSGA